MLDCDDDRRGKGSPAAEGRAVRIIVTGGAGFIGSHIVDRYLELGHDVLVVDSLWSHGGGRREHVPERAGFVHMDIRDDDLARVFAEFEPEIVCHHAAQHSVAIGSRDPKYDAQVNVIGLLNVLEATKRARARKVIYASSGATYGTPAQMPIDERTPQLPESPYGITKMVGEHYLRFYKNEHGIDFTSLRYANVYGPRQDPNGEAGVIAIFAGKFLAKTGVRIDWDGEQTRDYVFVGDVARANVLALERGSGGCYVIGTGVRTSVNQLYRTFVEITGFEAPIERAPKRSGDVRDAQFDAALAKRDLGWQPQIALLDGMRTTYEYFRDRSTSRV
jgi:UDP-glucose 4-epimerase